MRIHSLCSLKGYHKVALGVLDVVAPERIMEAPDLAFAQSIAFSDTARLVGYDLQLPKTTGDPVRVTLVWESLGQTTGNYKSFAHLVDEAGRLVVGSDMIPGNWQRPTTGWIAEEYVTDQHMLALPPGLATGTYRILVGLYDAETLQRVLKQDGGDHLVLSKTVELGLQ